MDLLFDLLLFAAGLVALYYGAEWLVGGSSRLATSFEIRPVVVGLTVVAFGTSAPELVVSGLASLRGSGDIAVGNVVGSNIANIALILGVSALIRPLRVHPGLIVRDVPIMIGFAVLLMLVALNGTVARFEGAALLVLFCLYILHVVREARREVNTNGTMEAAVEQEVLELLPGSEISRGREAFLVLVGTVALVIGAQLLVRASVSIARDLGVSEVVIGLTLVAFGTSIPELAASVVASIRAEAQIVLGNIVGSNIFNVSLVLGSAAVVRPLPVQPSVLYMQTPLMIGLSILLLPFVYKLSLERWEGGVLLSSYVAFLIWIFI